MKKNTTPRESLQKTSNNAVTNRIRKAICTNHSGKMQGMASISTSVLLNKHCMERAKDEKCICHYCYANRMLNMYHGLETKLADNTELLTTAIISPAYMPRLNYAWFRFEAFGDLNNETQVINYFNLCKANPQTRFTVWTKNPWIIQKAIELGYKKPANLTIIYSSPALNCRAENALNLYSFIDKIFTVWTKEYLANHPEIKINCGNKKCIECGICYRKNKIVFVDEVKK